MFPLLKFILCRRIIYSYFSELEYLKQKIMAEHLQVTANEIPLNLKDSINSIVKRHNYVTYEIVCEKIATNGASYMGILYEIEIKGKTNEDDKVLNIFVKNIVENVQMSIYSVPGVFETEAWTYNELSPIFTELQDEAKVPDIQRFKMPYSFDECNSKSILLEHLGKRGFKLYHRMDIITLEYAKMCISELAKFHALSFVINEKRPDYYKKNIITKKQPYNFNEDWYAIVKNMSNYTINNCLEPDVKEKLGEILFKKTANYPKYMTDTSGVCTLCHGDYKLNNVMAKEINGKITEVIPIDFQILHYGCPILDFIYFVFQGTDQEFRKNNLVYLKDLYYETMSSFLDVFGIDIGKYFPRAEFEKTYRAKLDFGLIINIFYGPFLYASESDAPDVTKEDLTTLDFKVDSRFIERFRGIVDDFSQWGYLESI